VKGLKGYCPFYDDTIGCGIHEDPRRPQRCGIYPLRTVYDPDRIGLCFRSDSEAFFHGGCEPFNRSHVIMEFRRRFPEPD